MISFNLIIVKKLNKWMINHSFCRRPKRYGTPCNSGTAPCALFLGKLCIASILKQARDKNCENLPCCVTMSTAEQNFKKTKYYGNLSFYPSSENLGSTHFKSKYIVKQTYARLDCIAICMGIISQPNIHSLACVTINRHQLH